MRYVTVYIVFLFLLIAFIFPDMNAFAGQAKPDLTTPVEQCLKDGKPLPTAKTKNNGIQAGGAWVKVQAPKMPPHPPGKSKAMPPHPLGKSAHPSTGQLEGKGSKAAGGTSIPGTGKQEMEGESQEEEELLQSRPAPERSWDSEIRPSKRGADALQHGQGTGAMGR